MTKKDKELFEKDEPINVDWESVVFSIIITAVVTFFLWLGCSIASNGASKYGPRAGVTKHLMKHFDAADRINAEKHRKQEARKEAKRKKQEAYENKLKAIFGYVPSDDEITLMLRVAMAESGNTEPIEGIERAIEVITNRVARRESFPNTITEVCYEKHWSTKYNKWFWQFDTVATGAIWQYEINDRVKQAWNNILERGYPVDDKVAYFTAGGYNPYCEPAYQIGNHYFGY